MFVQVNTLRGAESRRTEGSLKGMTGKNTRGLLVCAALAAVVVGATACGDSSTATAPLTQDATIATMSGHTSTSTDASGVADPSDESAASSSAEEAASSSAEEAASRATTTLPATKPSSTAARTGNRATSSSQTKGATRSEKEKNYLAALDRDDVSFLGDDEKTIALAWGHYVCRENGKDTDPSVVKVYIRAGIGPTTTSDQEAGAKADQLISAAEENLC